MMIIPLVCLLFSFNSTIWSVIVREFILALAVGGICIRTMKLYIFRLVIKFNFSFVTNWQSEQAKQWTPTRTSSFFSGKHSDWECCYVYPRSPVSTISGPAWSWWCSLLSYFNLIFISCFRQRETRDGLVRRVAHPT